MICLSDKATLIGVDRSDFVRHIYKLGAILERHPTTNNLYKHQQGHSSFVGQYIFREQKILQVLADIQ